MFCGHEIIVGGRQSDAMEEFAALWIAQLDDGTILAAAHDPVITVEAELGFVLGLAMTANAMLREDRLNACTVECGGSPLGESGETLANA